MQCHWCSSCRCSVTAATQWQVVTYSNQCLVQLNNINNIPSKLWCPRHPLASAMVPIDSVQPRQRLLAQQRASISAAPGAPILFLPPASLPRLLPPLCAVLRWRACWWGPARGWRRRCVRRTECSGLSEGRCNTGVVRHMTCVQCVRSF